MPWSRIRSALERSIAAAPAEPEIVEADVHRRVGADRDGGLSEGKDLGQDVGGGLVASPDAGGYVRLQAAQAQGRAVGFAVLVERGERLELTDVEGRLRAGGEKVRDLGRRAERRLAEATSRAQIGRASSRERG